MTERKSYAITEFKSAEDGAFSGILSTYGNVDLVGDIMEPGCFDSSVKEKGTKRPLLWQHDMHEPIGSFDVADTKGCLSIAGRFNLDVARGRDAYHLLKAGDVNGLSIGFRLRDHSYDADGHRLIKDVDLMEGSFVTFPANPLAYAEAKHMEKMKAGELRMAISALDGVKALSDADKTRLMKAVDGAFAYTESVAVTPTVTEYSDGDVETLASDAKALRASVDELLKSIKK